MLSIVRQRSGANVDKPSEVCRDYAARLPWAWDALCFAVPLHQADYEGLRDVANNAPASSLTGGTWIDDKGGNIVLSLGIGAYAQYADHPRHDLPSTALTAYARVRRTGGGNAYGGIISNPYSPGNPFTSWIIRDDSGPTGALIGGMAVSSSSLIETTATAVIGSTDYISVFLRWQAGTALRLDVLGERGNSLSSVTGPTSSGPIAYAASNGIRINNDEGGATFNGKYSQALVWSRRLTDVEMASLVADPFGWYSPRRETVVAAAPFPVGPGLASPGMAGAGQMSN